MSSFEMDEILITEGLRTKEDTDDFESVEISIQRDYDDLIRFSVATDEVCIMYLDDFIKFFDRALAIWKPLQTSGECTEVRE